MTPQPVAPQQSIRFGEDFELDPRPRRLRRGSRVLKLERIPLEILILLLERPGDLVTREQIVARVWGNGVFLDTDNSIRGAIRKIRQALKDDSDHPQFIQTVTGQGYRFIAPIIAAEQQGRADTPQSLSVAQPGSPNRNSWFARNRNYLFIAAGLLVVASALVRLLYRPHPVEQPVTVVPLTSLPGQEISPSFSPDGTQVAFGWDGENNGAGFDVYVKAVGADKPLRITNHPAAWLGAAWSPDGRHIAVSRDAGEYSGVFLVPPTGGPERKLTSASILSNFGTGISWSPDSKQLAFVRIGGGASEQLVMISIDSPDPAKALGTDCPASTAPAFSRDGQMLAFICIEDFGHFGIEILNLADGKIRKLFSAPGFIDGLAWSKDGGRIVYSFDEPGGIPGLWQIDVAHPQQREELSFGRDGSTPTINFFANRLAYAQQSQNVNIWRLLLNTKSRAATPFVMSTRQQDLPNISPDGSRVAFTSSRSGHQEIWVCDANGTNVMQLTFFNSMTGTPRWSPDGKQILFDSRYEGVANLYLIDAGGGASRRLDTGTRDNSIGSWSSDGRFIYFERDSTMPSVWKVPATGGPAVELVKPPSSYPIESPDGEYVYFVRSVNGKNHLWEIRPNGSDERLVDGMPPLRFIDEWWPVSDGIYLIGDVGTKQAIEFYDVPTKQVHQIYILEKPPEPWASGLALSKDRSWLLYSQVDETASDLMLVENFH